jgi:hypothetical protein
VRFDAICELIAFLPGKRPGHEFHHARIGIHASEWFAVGRDPTSQNESVCFDHHPEQPLNRF